MKVSELFDMRRPFWVGFWEGLALMPIWRFVGRKLAREVSQKEEA